MVFVESQVSEKPLTENGEREIWLQSLGSGRREEDVTLIRRALELAERAHLAQVRASGEPYINHVVAVADILAGLRLDAETIAAAVLHDAVEDSEVSLAQIAEYCSPAVARLVDGVTKLKVFAEFHEAGKGKKESARAESLRKMLLAMAEDVRVVLIKLADRLHNMRTLDYLDQERRERIARETLDIYAPLANRLGIWQLKWELEDLSFRHLEPDTYREIARFLDERRVDRQRYIEGVVQVLEAELSKAGIKADVKGRPKHIYSIWKKMQRKGLGFHQVYDVRAVRILVDSVADCYHALGVVHTLWRHIPKEFDDYIATPKENNYQSIHTAVVGPEGKTVEVQIRTWDMDRHAELGVAAHWRYKEGGKSDRAFEQKIAWLRQLLEWKEEESNAGDFIDRFKSEVFQDRVYVFTPRGEIIDLPQGATALDFAYHIHTDIGHRCRGAKVEGRIVPLTYELRNGEQVEVLTSKHPAPSRDWLNPHLGYLKTSRARAKVRSWFKQQDQEQNLADGRQVVERELKRLGVTDVPLERIAAHFNLSPVDDFMVAVGRGDITTSQLASALHQITRPPAPPPGEPTAITATPRKGEGGDIHIQGVGNLLTTLSRCCKPAPGDPIVGFITRGRGVAIHRSDCTNILNLPSELRRRLIEVAWAGKEQSTYPVDIEIEAIDRQGLLRDVSSLLANEKINVIAASTVTDRHTNTARMQLTLEIANTDQLSRVLSRIVQLPNVTEARRHV
ncbi:MAG: GTP diphosphokinase [Thiohalomonadaceae bacterium]